MGRQSGPRRGPLPGARYFYVFYLASMSRPGRTRQHTTRPWYQEFRIPGSAPSQSAMFWSRIRIAVSEPMISIPVRTTSIQRRTLAPQVLSQLGTQPVAAELAPGADIDSFRTRRTRCCTIAFACRRTMPRSRASPEEFIASGSEKTSYHGPPAPLSAVRAASSARMCCVCTGLSDPDRERNARRSLGGTAKRTEMARHFSVGSINMDRFSMALQEVGWISQSGAHRLAAVRPSVRYREQRTPTVSDAGAVFRVVRRLTDRET